MDYVRVKLSINNPVTNKIIWAIKRTSQHFIHYEQVNKDGSKVDPHHVFIAKPEDVIWEKPAAISLKYCELFLTEDDNEGR